MTIGRDLLDLPFAELVRNLAVAIADGQTALDRNSLETLKALAEVQVEVLSGVTEVIEPTITPVTVAVPGGDAGTETVQVTGARVRPSGVERTTMSMLQAGLFPTFYQFTEASIEVKIAITMHEDSASDTTGSTSAAAGFLGLRPSRAYVSTVDYRTQNTYSYDASGSSVLRATMRPVPPPSRLQPAITTINTFTDPPTVTTV
ncbi:hypothetical protein [Actinoplanes sp. NPDC049265]|uniref:hypothetical protein n=1 Tax=Actinoplanes sp. NPDC049265 TaxID=3363902 RepID=UPI00372349B9